MLTVELYDQRTELISFLRFHGLPIRVLTSTGRFKGHLGDPHFVSLLMKRLPLDAIVFLSKFEPIRIQLHTFEKSPVALWKYFIFSV